MPNLRQSILSGAILCGITAGASGSVVGQQKVIEEVLVTATKREASAQDNSVTLQAIDQSTLSELNVGNFDDYIRHIPNMTAGGRGPGQSSIYIRGMATSTISVQLAGANGSVGTQRGALPARATGHPGWPESGCLRHRYATYRGSSRPPGNTFWLQSPRPAPCV